MPWITITTTTGANSIVFYDRPVPASTVNQAITISFSMHKERNDV